MAFKVGGWAMMIRRAVGKATENRFATKGLYGAANASQEQVVD
jgi:hypothetical protein